MRRIAAVVPHALGWAPGQRVRIEAWAEHLEPLGWHVDFIPFESEALRKVIYTPGHAIEKVWHMTACYARQLRRLLHGTRADAVFLYREASLIGPAILERVAAGIGPPLVYDIDDPVFLPYKSPANHWLSLLKFSRKTNAMLRLADHVICVNQRIATYAHRFNDSVSVVPNSVDTDTYRPIDSAPQLPIRLAWIGSQSTLPNLHAITGPLRKLQERYDVRLRLIGPSEIESLGIKAERKAWSAQSEVADLQGCHIGIVPLQPHPWNEWKFFFKTIQYMSVGLPVVAADEGSNQEIVRDGVSGFLVHSQAEWYERLAELCGDEDRRRRMGEAARTTIVQRYSFRSQIGRVAATFDSILSRAGKGA